MSENLRKNKPDYEMSYRYKNATVFRPNSMRQVSAVKELNRLKDQLAIEIARADALRKKLEKLE